MHLTIVDTNYKNKLLTVLPGWEARPQSFQLILLCCYWTSPWNK